MYRLFTLSLFPKHYSRTTIYIEFPWYEGGHAQVLYKYHTIYVRDMRIHEFWYHWVSWNQPPWTPRDDCTTPPRFQETPLLSCCSASLVGLHSQSHFTIQDSCRDSGLHGWIPVKRKGEEARVF